VKKLLIFPLKIKHSGGFPGNIFAAEQPAVSLLCSACVTHNEKMTAMYDILYSCHVAEFVAFVFIYSKPD
jgi:hypothetical protein